MVKILREFTQCVRFKCKAKRDVRGAQDSLSGELLLLCSHEADAIYLVFSTSVVGYNHPKFLSLFLLSHFLPSCLMHFVCSNFGLSVG